MILAKSFLIVNQPLYFSKINPDNLVTQFETLDLNLKIDDSGRPLTILNNEIPNIEIEDLSLELETPDDPDKDKSWPLKHQAILFFFFNQLKKVEITQLIKVFFQKRLDFKVNFDYKH